MFCGLLGEITAGTILIFVAVTTLIASLLYIIIGINMVATAAGSAEVLLVSQS
jgi:hypothetical protein